MNVSGRAAASFGSSWRRVPAAELRGFSKARSPRATLAAFISSLPLFVKPARAALEGVGADLENAARLLGKTEWQVIRTITLPLAWRGILAGAVMAFARATGEFGATLMVAGNIPGVTQTLPIAIYDAVQSGESNAANLLVLIITLFSFTVLFAAGKIGRGRL